jgi:hypothetical protein
MNNKIPQEIEKEIEKELLKWGEHITIITNKKNEMWMTRKKFQQLQKSLDNIRRLLK